jgi:hypothetical protein
MCDTTNNMIKRMKDGLEHNRNDIKRKAAARAFSDRQ